RDASIFEVVPKGIIAPRYVSDITNLVQYASKKTRAGQYTSLTVRAGGTDMSGGPLTEGLVVDLTKYLNRVGEVDTVNRRVRTQGGAWHRDVEAATHPLGLLFGPYTSSHQICTIGGMVSNNSSGEKSVKFGATSDNVDRLSVVLSDGNEYEFGPLTRAELEAKKAQPDFEGEVYRRITRLIDDNKQLLRERKPKTVKNAAGYAIWDVWDDHEQVFNMARLFIGSQGTLGFVTEAELKLVPLAPNSRMIVTPIGDLDNLPEVVNTTLTYGPATCETFDHFTYDLAKIHHPDEARLAYVADGKHMVILSVFEGRDQHLTDVTAGRAKEHLESLGHETFWIDDTATIEAFLNIRRWSFQMLLDHPKPGTRAMAFLEDTIVPLERYAEFLRQLEAILTEYDMTYTYAGHIAAGSIRLIPLVDMERENAAEHIMELETRVNKLVVEFNGSISVDHNDGIIRTPYLEMQFGAEMVAIFGRIKDIFDPLRIFNPGKKVDGTYQYAVDHIIRENV
ncbi:MAG TPA: FAD-binding oxidoreductase, partial [Candidatus Saccharimonadales bacterium]|nr:FAD-binding oxidoreductase [Candidatus Saccharimonadales bacterium]